MKSISIFALATLLAACTVNDNENAANEADVTAEQTEDVPIQGGGSAPPSGAPSNEQAPGAPPAEEPRDNISLAAAPQRVAPGGTVTLTLTNGTDHQIGYNLCTSALQTAAGAAVPTDRVCTMELRTLEPGRNANFGYVLPGSLADGRYRFSTGVEHMPEGRRSMITSNTIEVR